MNYPMPAILSVESSRPVVSFICVPEYRGQVILLQQAQFGGIFAGFQKKENRKQMLTFILMFGLVFFGVLVFMYVIKRRRQRE